MSQKENEQDSAIDQEFFDSRRQIGEGFIEKLVEVFCLEAPKLIGTIANTVGRDDASQLAKLGHKLKGMCLNVGATRLSALGEEIEASASRNDLTEIGRLVREAEEEFSRARTEMERLIRRKR